MNPLEETLGVENGDKQEAFNKLMARLDVAQPFLLPEEDSAYLPLQGKKLLMVDDGRSLIQAYLPTFFIATGGKADFILHEQQSIEDLLVAILEAQAEVIMMDYFLNMGVYGTKLVSDLRSRDFTGKIVGFSSDPNKAHSFVLAGADGFIFKHGYPEDRTLELVSLLGTLNK